MAQAEQLKQQTLATLSDRDQQLRQLSAMLEEARSHQPKLQQDHYQREVGLHLLTPTQGMETPPADDEELSVCAPPGHRGGGHRSRSPAAAQPVGEPRPPG